MEYAIYTKEEIILMWERDTYLLDKTMALIEEIEELRNKSFGEIDGLIKLEKENSNGRTK